MQSCYLAVLLSCANTGTRALLVSMPMLAPNAPPSPTRCWCPCNAGAHAIPAAMRRWCPRQASLQHSCATPHLHNNPCNSSTDSIATCSPDPQLPTGGHKPAAPLTPCTHTALLRCPSMQRRPPCPPHDPAAIGATHCSSPPGISWSPWCPRNPRGPGSCVARPRCPVGTQRGGQRGHGGLGVSGTGRSGGGARVSLPGRAPPWLCSPPRCVPALSPAAPCPALRCAGEERRH